VLPAVAGLYGNFGRPRRRYPRLGTVTAGSGYPIFVIFSYAPLLHGLFVPNSPNKGCSLAPALPPLDK